MRRDVKPHRRSRPRAKNHAYVHASRLLHPRTGGGAWPCKKATEEDLHFLPFRLKCNVRRTARVIGRDLFKRENYPEGVVEHRRFNSRLNGGEGAAEGVRARSSFPPTPSPSREREREGEKEGGGKNPANK